MNVGRFVHRIQKIKKKYLYDFYTISDKLGISKCEYVIKILIIINY